MLRQIPGFSLLRQSSSLVNNFSIQGVSLRGTGATAAGRTLVLLDGIPLNDPFGSTVTWTRLPLEAIEREPRIVGAFLWKWFPEPRPVGRNFQLATDGMKAAIAGVWRLEEDGAPQRQVEPEPGG